MCNLHSEARNDKYPSPFIQESSPETVSTLLLNLQLNYLLFSKTKELFAKLLQKNREFAQFFLAVALKKTVVTTAQLLQFVAHSSLTCDPVYITFQKIKIKQSPGCRIRETED